LIALATARHRRFRNQPFRSMDDPRPHSRRRVGMDVVNRHFLPKEAIAMLSVHRTQDRPFSRSMEFKSG
jgi:hypothetical protein